jgi:putative MATE family efflux protein
MAQVKTRNFTEGRILPLIVNFTVPLMLTGILQLLFNTADTVMVGRWGGDTPAECETALAAVGSCGALINMIIILFANLSLGAGVSVAQDIGARNFDGVHRTVHTAVLLASVLGVLTVPVGILGARTFLTWMGTDASVLEDAALYMTAVFCGIPASMLYNYCAAILRSSGETVRPLKYLLISGALNVALNAIAVVWLRMGALGVGIATAASNWVSLALILLHMTRAKDCPYHLDLRRLRIDGEKLRFILRIGIPASIQGMIFTVSHLMIQSTVNSFGPAAMAGNAAAGNIEGYAYQPTNAFYQTAVTFVGQHKGAGKYRRMKRCILLICACTAAVGFLLSFTMILLGRPLLWLYQPENDAAVAAGMLRVTTYLPGLLVCGLMEVGSGVMRGLGHSTTAMITSLLGSVALRVLWILFIFPLYPTLPMLYVSFPITWIITASTHFILAIRAWRREARLHPEQEEAPALAKA